MEKDQIFGDDAYRVLILENGIISFNKKLIIYSNGKYLVSYDGNIILEDVSVSKAVTLYNELR